MFYKNILLSHFIYMADVEFFWYKFWVYHITFSRIDVINPFIFPLASQHSCGLIFNFFRSLYQGFHVSSSLYLDFKYCVHWYLSKKHWCSSIYYRLECIFGNLRLWNQRNHLWSFVSMFGFDNLWDHKGKRVQWLVKHRIFQSKTQEKKHYVIKY